MIKSRDVLGRFFAALAHHLEGRPAIAVDTDSPDTWSLPLVVHSAKLVEANADHLHMTNSPDVYERALVVAEFALRAWAAVERDALDWMAQDQKEATDGNG